MRCCEIWLDLDLKLKGAVNLSHDGFMSIEDSLRKAGLPVSESFVEYLETVKKYGRDSKKLEKETSFFFNCLRDFEAIPS